MKNVPGTGIGMQQKSRGMCGMTSAGISSGSNSYKGDSRIPSFGNASGNIH